MKYSATITVLASLLVSTAGAETIRVESGRFSAARSWFQFDQDVEKNLFRSYAGLGIDGRLVDVPNLFVMSCPADDSAYMTMHFPENYVLTGFSAEDWLPTTNVFVRTEKGTFRFDAELNQNEFHIDLGDKEFDYLHELWADNGQIEFKLGPANAHITLSFAPADDSIAKLLETKGPIAAKYSFLEMRTRCQAASIASEKTAEWKIFGSLSCPTCSGTNGKTYSFVTIDSKDEKKKMRSLRDCESAKKKLIATLMEQNAKGDALVPDFLCVGNGSWH